MSLLTADESDEKVPLATRGARFVNSEQRPHSLTHTHTNTRTHTHTHSCFIKHINNTYICGQLGINH